MRKATRKIYVPWQHKFIAGLFFQLGLCSDRDVALYLQRESAYPKDGSAEDTFRIFAKGVVKFPKAWAKFLLDKCTEAFIERWRDDIFNFALESNLPNKSETQMYPIKSSPVAEPESKVNQPPEISTIKSLEEKCKPIEIQFNTLRDVTPRKTPLSMKETATESHSNKKPIKQEKIAETKPLPEAIVKILTISLSESLEADGKLNPRKLVRALNKRSNGYNVKRKEREIYFLGKRVEHKFIIPLNIELTA